MSDLPLRLRPALQAASFTYDAVADLLGTRAHEALGRNETTPALRQTRHREGAGSPLATLTRLFLLQTAVSSEDAERALPGLVGDLEHAGFLRTSGGEVRALLDVRPYATEDRDLWVVSDLTPGLDGPNVRVADHHVLGISPAATSLAQLTLRDPVARALDLGTGCGVQALHLSAHARHVVATDVNPRALWLTRLNAGLNRLSTGSTAGGIDVREGSFFEPVRGETFDLVVSNPPFVISPAAGDRLVYRDSGLPGDAVVEHIVRAVPGHLTEGGLCQVLGNWMVLRDHPWEERLTGWVAGCDAWVVQRETVDLPTYVELWLKDAGLHPSTGTGSTADYVRRYDTWLAWFEEQGAEAVGFGWIHLRRVSTGTGEVHRLEDWPYAVAQPLGDEVAAHFRRTTQLRGLSDARFLATRPVARPDVVQETLGAPGAEDPGQIVLRQRLGLRRARPVGTAEAALVGACDGELTVAQILAALDQILGAHGGSTGAVRDLVADGFLEL